MKSKFMITIIQILLAIIFTYILIKTNIDILTSILLFIIYTAIMVFLNRFSRKLTEVK